MAALTTMAKPQALNPLKPLSAEALLPFSPSKSLLAVNHCTKAMEGLLSVIPSRHQSIELPGFGQRLKLFLCDWRTPFLVLWYLATKGADRPPRGGWFWGLLATQGRALVAEGGAEAPASLLSFIPDWLHFLARVITN